MPAPSAAAIIELEFGQHVARQPVPPEGNGELAATLGEVWLRQRMGEALADHHESTGAVFLDVAGQKKRLVIALPVAKERPQIILLDITVARPVGPIPEIVVPSCSRNSVTTRCWVKVSF